MKKSMDKLIHLNAKALTLCVIPLPPLAFIWIQTSPFCIFVFFILSCLACTVNYFTNISPFFCVFSLLFSLFFSHSGYFHNIAFHFYVNHLKSTIRYTIKRKHSITAALPFYSISLFHVSFHHPEGEYLLYPLSRHLAQQ